MTTYKNFCKFLLTFYVLIYRVDSCNSFTDAVSMSVDCFTATMLGGAILRMDTGPGGLAGSSGLMVNRACPGWERALEEGPLEKAAHRAHSLAGCLGSPCRLMVGM